MHNALDIGKLRNRIKLINLKEVENELGETEKKEVTIKTVWARVELKTGKELEQNDKIKNNKTLKIKIRYLKEINPEMIIEFGGERYFITKIDNYRFLNKEMNLEVSKYRN